MRPHPNPHPNPNPTPPIHNHITNPQVRRRVLGALSCRWRSEKDQGLSSSGGLRSAMLGHTWGARCGPIILSGDAWSCTHTHTHPPTLLPTSSPAPPLIPSSSIPFSSPSSLSGAHRDAQPDGLLLRRLRQRWLRALVWHGEPGMRAGTESRV